MNFGDNLKKELLWQGISQTELGKMLDVPKNTINGWIHGRGYPNLRLFVRLCYILKVSADELLDIEFH